MGSTSQGERGRPPAWRAWVFLFVGVAVFVAVLELLERLFPRERAAPGAVAELQTAPAEPIRPKITRRGNVVEIEVGFHRTTIRLSEGEGSADDLVACLEEGIDRAIADGRLEGPPASDDFFARLMRDAEVSKEMNRIAYPCFRSPLGELPVPPLPAPGAAPERGR